MREVAKLYGVPVILHTDHCMRSWLPWFDGLLEANEDYYAKNGEPLFSSHMLDLSEEPLEENVATCVEYLERMAKSDLLLEMELGVTGGEEDGVGHELVEGATDLKVEVSALGVGASLGGSEGGSGAAAAGATAAGAAGGSSEAAGGGNAAGAAAGAERCDSTPSIDLSLHSSKRTSTESRCIL